MALSVLLAGCAGGRGDAEDAGQSRRAADTSDIDRILAENPDAANAGELRRLREEMANDPKQQGRKAAKMQDPYDRRAQIMRPSADRLRCRSPYMLSRDASSRGSGGGAAAPGGGALGEAMRADPMRLQ
jgi:hypothetical protein